MQILHERIRKHRVLISSIDCNENTIEVYDSYSFFKTVTPTTVSTICQILQPNPGSIINIKLVNTQRQRNASDCGVFVCAFMDSLLRGRRPVGVMYDIP